MLGHTSKIFAILTLALGLVLLTQSSGFAQDNNGGNNNNGGANNNGGGNGDDGGGNDEQLGGVEIAADGVLNARLRVGNVRLLNRRLALAAQQSLNKDLMTPSKLRKISINRLEQEVGKLIEAGKPIPADMKYLAGMTRITNVFFFPESGDIVIAGPAEGYFVNAENYVVGLQSGRATLQLDDLVVALRAFSPDGKNTRMISCSIDPTKEGLVNFMNTYKNIAASGQFRPGLEGQVVQAFKQSLGMQTITVKGVSPKTNFARVLVEADFEMKMVGIGLTKPAVPVTSFISKATPGPGNAVQRWFFQPDYDCVNVNEDRTAMELVGDGVKLVGEDESVNAQGDRKGKGKMNRASRSFCSSFTKNYSKLAAAEPIWAELRNVIDLSVAAAFIQKMDYYEKAGWQMNVFGDEQLYSVERFEAATQVAPVANAVWKQGMFMAPIAGGVAIQPRVALNSDRMNVDDAGKIDKVREQITLSNLEAGQWWWD